MFYKKFDQYNIFNWINLHFAANTIIFISCIIIAIMLYKLYISHKNLHFNKLFYAFSIFVIFCGLTHFIEIIAALYNLYYLEFLIKIIYAIVSVLTAIFLIKILPQMICLTNQFAIVDELKQTNEQLEEVNYELENFAMVAAHDIQDPLKQNKMFFKLIKSGKIEFLEEVIKNNDRMIIFIKNLLDFARYGSTELKTKKVDLKTILHQSLQNISLKISEVLPEIKIGELPEIDCDPIQFGRVFQNLISNSIKCKYDGRKLIISISCKKINDNWEITVEDNGKGIDKEQMKHLFAIYRGKKNDNTGAGFGLAICKKVIEAHKGTISAETELEVGTKFIITIPAN